MDSFEFGPIDIFKLGPNTRELITRYNEHRYNTYSVTCEYLQIQK